MGCGDWGAGRLSPSGVFGARFLPGGEDLLVMVEGDKTWFGFFSLPGGELTDIVRGV